MVVIDARNVAVIWNARIVCVNDCWESMLGKGECATVMIRDRNVVLVSKILITPHVPLVRIGVQSTCQAIRRLPVRGKTRTVWLGDVFEPVLS